MKVLEIIEVALSILAIIEAIALLIAVKIIKFDEEQLVKEIKYSTKLENKIKKLENEV